MRTFSMNTKKIASLLSLAVLFALAAFNVNADTIKLRNGSVIKGKIVEMKNQQITVQLEGKGERRSQLTFYLEEIKSIEFDDDAGSIAANDNNSRQTVPAIIAPQTGNNTNRDGSIVVSNAGNNSTAASRPAQPDNNNSSNNSTASRPNTNQNSGGISPIINSQPSSSTGNSRPNTGNGRFIPVAVKVLADDTANGWTNTGLVVKKGQRIRITANGRVSLGSGKYATPAGVGSLSDSARLMKTEPTGALIAVVGDDNNEFIFVGSSTEFVAQRDGTLFLGVNEGNLEDNSGAFDATVEAEAIDATAQR